ncbi:hypothetical protein AB833_10690 [Chromatiales bacterium (ex Bugula neritina AB1)]|nr:hypothetical protein AB833_10690 [Chromatiales bacterium (ex Bugula neritina AB1)]
MHLPNAIALIAALILGLFLPLSESTVSAQDTTTRDTATIEIQKFKLFRDLSSAQTEAAGRAAENAIWQFWFAQAPTPEVRKLLDAGIERREAYDFEAAEKHLDKVVEAAPDYAEGFNQRAFVRFLRENFSDASDDLERALALEPDHFGAMAGQYQILRIENRHQAAFTFLQEAVTLHPWLRERGALPREMWPDAYRDLHDKKSSI